MTLADVLKIALAAYDEDQEESEIIVAQLAPVLLGDRDLLRAAITRAWDNGSSAGDTRTVAIAIARDEIRAALTEYQAERARLDAEDVKAGERDCTCLGTCRGAAGLAPGWPEPGAQSPVDAAVTGPVGPTARPAQSAQPPATTTEAYVDDRGVRTEHADDRDDHRRGAAVTDHRQLEVRCGGSRRSSQTTATTAT